MKILSSFWWLLILKPFYMVIVSIAEIDTKREANFRESNIDADFNFQKVLVGDQGLLGMLANNAYYARQAACLGDESERLSTRFFTVCAALEIASEYAVKPTVVTFGQPKMGNMKFAQFVATKITLYRVTYRDDFTPSVPKFGYNFDGKAIEYFQFSSEYWIPFQDQCECSPLFTKTSDLGPPIKFPSVYNVLRIVIKIVINAEKKTVE
ncbi:hypothetical protein G9A89_006785 [Geosiphon pyriformis]|nr:hypothetical protein G9A89_006785 [Geosiphon pyriformis]